MSGWQNSSVDPAIAALNVDLSFLLLGIYGYTVLLGIKEKNRLKLLF